MDFLLVRLGLVRDFYGLLVNKLFFRGYGMTESFLESNQINILLSGNLKMKASPFFLENVALERF